MVSLDAEKPDDGQESLTDEQVSVVNDNIALAYALASESKERRIDLDDRRQLACLGLIKAVQTHDPAKGELSTHAAWCIRGEIEHAARKSHAMPSIDALADDGYEPTAPAEPATIDPDDAQRLRAIVLSLPVEFRKPIVDRYWRGKTTRGLKARAFEAGAMDGLRRATSNGENMPESPPNWRDPNTQSEMTSDRTEADIKLMRALERLKLLPRFPVLSFTPNSACVHKGPLPAGSLEYCPCCHASGQDGLKIPTDVQPLPRDKPKTPPAATPRPTRKQRRKRAKEGAAA